MSAADAEVLPSRGSLDPRIRTAPYSEGEVYRLYGYVGYAIELIFEDGELFEGEAGGDLEGIVFGAHTHHLILKPRAATVATNLIIYTNRRAYRFQYSAVDQAPDLSGDEVMYAVRFIYPPPPAPAVVATSAERAQRALEHASTARERNLDYGYCGAPELKPTAAYDDGVHTRLTFAAKAELPAIFLANEDGSESLLNFNVEGDDILIQRVAKRFILRRGKLTGCIVNKGFSGGGERLESGTIAPDVERARKGGQP
jgi:type IV secretion system protein VirB9